MNWQDLETSLNAPPRFFVQPPDGRKDWTEEARQIAFFNTLGRFGRGLVAYHPKNEGAHNYMRAKRNGVRPGVFDIRVDGLRPLSAVIEMKGYTKAGRAGVLSQAQIDYGNTMLDLGWLTACFFDPYDAVDWLRGNGFPIVSFARAA